MNVEWINKHIRFTDRMVDLIDADRESKGRSFGEQVRLAISSYYNMEAPKDHKKRNKKRDTR